MSMGFELERILYETEDFLRRNLRSRSAREASKRRARRRWQEAMRRLRRAAIVLAGLLAALVLLAIGIGGISFLTWVVALPTVFLIAFLTVFWGEAGKAEAAADPAARQALPLAELAMRAEDGLIDRTRELPGRALPAADTIISRLNELQPHLGRIDPQSLLAGDARRLIGEHLPKLVDSYLDLPDRDRAPMSESTQRLTDSLEIVADELGDLLTQATSEKQMSFETHRRFIESRYGEDDALRGSES